MMIEFRVQMEAPSTPNLREHHMARARRTKRQREAVARKMPTWEGKPLLHVRLTRVAPRALDGDNCAAALKAHRDACASRLRIDDASPLVLWHYAQAKGEAEVVVQIWRDGDEAPPVPAGRMVKRKPLATVTADAGKRLSLVRESGSGTKRAPTGMVPPRKGALRTKPCGCLRALGRCEHETPRRGDAAKARGWALGMVEAAYTPPRSTPVDAARDADETFAPPPTCHFCKGTGTTKSVDRWPDPTTRTPVPCFVCDGSGKQPPLESEEAP